MFPEQCWRNNFAHDTQGTEARKHNSCTRSRAAQDSHSSWSLQQGAEARPAQTLHNRLKKQGWSTTVAQAFHSTQRKQDWTARILQKGLCRTRFAQLTQRVKGRQAGPAQKLHNRSHQKHKYNVKTCLSKLRSFKAEALHRTRKGVLLSSSSSSSTSSSSSRSRSRSRSRSSSSSTTTTLRPTKTHVTVQGQHARIVYAK